MTKHLSHEQLLRHLDGELSRFAGWQAAAHVKNCWACQVELDHLKEQIAAIVDAQSAVFAPSLAPPPGPWARLEPRLERARTDSSPVWSKAAPFAERSSFRARLAYCAAALAVVAVGFSLWFSAPPVFAKEVLTRVAAADGGRLAITERKVARQRVRVSRTSGASPAKSARVESWKSRKSSYWEAGDPIGAELLTRYRSNGLESALPLSPEAMETWVKIAGAEPSVTREQGSIGVEVAANTQARARGLEGISIHVRAENWHLDEMTLSFSDTTYRITEEESSVVAREDVPREVMAHLEPSEPASMPSAESAVSHPVVLPVNLDDLEMGVRSDLHRMGADLGEAIEIVPLPPDRLRVEARQVSPETRENLAALLGNKPGVQLEFQPAAGGAAGPRTRVIPQAGGSRAPEDPRLAEFFGSAEAQENYTQALFDRSNSVLAHLYALRELAGRWSEDQERSLSTDGKSTLHAIVRDHVTAVREASSGMRNQLAPLLEHFGMPVTEPVPNQSGTSWREASQAALDAALRVDQTLRSLLTHSDSPLSIEQALPRLRQGLGDLQDAAVRP